MVVNKTQTFFYNIDQLIKTYSTDILIMKDNTTKLNLKVPYYKPSESI